MILNKHAYSHTTRIPTIHSGVFRASFFVLAQFLRSNPQANRKGKERQRSVQEQQVSPLMYSRKERWIRIRRRKRCYLRAASAFSSLGTECVLLQDVLCHELSLLKPTSNSPNDESGAVTMHRVAACYWEWWMRIETNRSPRKIHNGRFHLSAIL